MAFSSSQTSSAARVEASVSSSCRVPRYIALPHDLYELRHKYPSVQKCVLLECTRCRRWIATEVLTSIPDTVPDTWTIHPTTACTSPEFEDKGHESQPSQTADDDPPAPAKAVSMGGNDRAHAWHSPRLQAAMTALAHNNGKMCDVANEEGRDNHSGRDAHCGGGSSNEESTALQRKNVKQENGEGAHVRDSSDSTIHPAAYYRNAARASHPCGLYILNPLNFVCGWRMCEVADTMLDLRCAWLDGLFQLGLDHPSRSETLAHLRSSPVPSLAERRASEAAAVDDAGKDKEDACGTARQESASSAAVFSLGQTRRDRIRLNEQLAHELHVRRSDRLAHQKQHQRHAREQPTLESLWLPATHSGNDASGNDVMRPPAVEESERSARHSTRGSSHTHDGHPSRDGNGDNNTKDTSSNTDTAMTTYCSNGRGANLCKQEVHSEDDHDAHTSRTETIKATTARDAEYAEADSQLYHATTNPAPTLRRSDTKSNSTSLSRRAGVDPFPPRAALRVNHDAVLLSAFCCVLCVRCGKLRRVAQPFPGGGGSPFVCCLLPLLNNGAGGNPCEVSEQEGWVCYAEQYTRAAVHRMRMATTHGVDPVEEELRSHAQGNYSADRRNSDSGTTARAFASAARLHMQSLLSMFASYYSSSADVVRSARRDEKTGIGRSQARRRCGDDAEDGGEAIGRGVTCDNSTDDRARVKSSRNTHTTAATSAASISTSAAMTTTASNCPTHKDSNRLSHMDRIGATSSDAMDAILPTLKDIVANVRKRTLGNFVKQIMLAPSEIRSKREAVLTNFLTHEHHTHGLAAIAEEDGSAGDVPHTTKAAATASTRRRPGLHANSSKTSNHSSDGNARRSQANDFTTNGAIANDQSGHENTPCDIVDNTAATRTRDSKRSSTVTTTTTTTTDIDSSRDATSMSAHVDVPHLGAEALMVSADHSVCSAFDSVLGSGIAPPKKTMHTRRGGGKRTRAPLPCRDATSDDAGGKARNDGAAGNAACGARDTRRCPVGKKGKKDPVVVGDRSADEEKSIIHWVLCDRCGRWRVVRRPVSPSLQYWQCNMREGVETTCDDTDDETRMNRGDFDSCLMTTKKKARQR